MTIRVRTDDWGRLAQTITLEHRHSYRAEITLQLNVQQRTTTYKEAHSAAKTFANGLEDKLVKQFNQWPTPCLPTTTIPIFLIIFNRIVERKLIQALYGLTFRLDAGLNVLAEVTGEGRY